MLAAWVNPVVRDAARAAAQDAGVPFSAFVEWAVQRAVAALTAERALRKAKNRGDR
jgi:hypothetical protein